MTQKAEETADREMENGAALPSGLPAAGANRSRLRHRIWKPLILLFGLAISAASAGVVHDILSEESKADREISRQSLALGLQSYVDREIGFVRQMRGLFDSSNFVSAEEFQRYARLDPNIRDREWWIALGWAARRGGAGQMGAMAPDLQSSDVFPLTYVEPAGEAATRLLSDPAAADANRTVMLAAAESDTVQITAPQDAIVDGHHTKVVSTFLPVFKKDASGQNAALQGFLIGSIALDGFFDSFLSQALADSALSIRIYDGTTLVYSKGAARGPALPATLRLGRRELQLQIDGDGNALESAFWLPVLVFLAGLAVTVLVYLRTVRADIEYRRIRSEVNRATAELAAANLELAQRSARLQEVADDLRETSQQAQLANAAKTVFLANMSHELRTPLNAVLGFSEMISSELHGPASPRYSEYARDIYASGKYLLSIIEDLLDMSRIELGQFQLREETIDVLEVVNELVRFTAQRAREKRIRIGCTGLEALPKLYADPRALRQSMLNLLTNAIKFSGADAPIDISGRIDDQGGMAISVSDRGPGVRSEELNRIFEPFWQAEAYRRQERDGLGLGLAIAKRLVEAHDGVIDVRNREDGGTTFTIRMPSARIRRAGRRLSVLGGSGDAA
jgi:signal transduction histidine kinase